MTPFLRNIPNVLTAVRVLLAPLTAYLIVRGNDLDALGVFAVAGASDAVDGFLARRFGLVSRFGEYLDPAADKLLMLICFVTLTMIHQAPLWLSAVVIGRDVAIVLGVLVARVAGSAGKNRAARDRQGEHRGAGRLYQSSSVAAVVQSCHAAAHDCGGRAGWRCSRCSPGSPTANCC